VQFAEAFLVEPYLWNRGFANLMGHENNEYMGIYLYCPNAEKKAFAGQIVTWRRMGMEASGSKRYVVSSPYK